MHTQQVHSVCVCTVKLGRNQKRSHVNLTLATLKSLSASSSLGNNKNIIVSVVKMKSRHNDDVNGQASHVLAGNEGRVVACLDEMYGSELWMESLEVAGTGDTTASSHKKNCANPSCWPRELATP